MKKILTIILVCLVHISFGQQGTTIPKKTNSSEAKPIIKPTAKPANSGIVLTVLPATVACNNDANSQCLQIKKQGNNNYETVDDIENFNYDLGYTYTILVKEMLRNPPIKANESIYRYVWIKTMSKIEVEYAAEKTQITTTNSGAVIGKTTMNTTSPLDGKWYLRKMKEAEGSSFVTDDNIMYVEIKSFNDRLDGFGACNKFAAVVKSDLNTTFLVSKLTSDYDNCGNKKIEDLFYSLLQQADKFEVKNGNLILSKQWNYLLEFVSDPKNKEGITITYTKPAIVREEDATYATDENLKSPVKPVDKQQNTNYNTTETTNTDDAEAMEMQRKIDEMKQALEAKKQKAANDAKKMDEEKLAQQKADAQAAKIAYDKEEELRKKDEQAKLKATAEKEKLKAEKQKELERLQKEMDELDKPSAEINAPKPTAPKPTATKPIETKKTTSTTTTKTTKYVAAETVTKTPNQNDNSKTNTPKSNEKIAATKETNTSGIPEPDFENIVYFLKDKTLNILDRTTATFKGNTKESYLELPDIQSSNQYKKNQLPKLYIKITDGIIPNDFLFLHICDYKKEKRIINLTSKKETKSLTFKKISKDVFEIILPTNLETNEYTFVTTKDYDLLNDVSFNSTTTKVSCFGIEVDEQESSMSSKIEKTNYKAPIQNINYSTKINEIPEVDFTETPYYVTQNNTLKKLERAEAKQIMKSKSHMTSTKVYDIFYEINSNNSSLRFSKSNLPIFVIRLDNNKDPSELINISKAIIKKDKRKFIVGKIGERMLKKKEKDINETHLELEFKKIRPGVYQIILPNDLSEGEYALLPIDDNNSSNALNGFLGRTQTISCFGIDP